MLFISNTSVAQKMGTRNYDPKTVTTIKGTVEKVETASMGKRGNTGIHLVVQTASEKMTVHVGPQWYIEKQGMTFKEGDKVTVEGSKVTIDGEQVIIAREVKKGTKTLELRDKDGIPKWAGQGRR